MRGGILGRRQAGEERALPTPFKRMLMEELRGRLPEHLLPLLPSGLQIIGHVAILSLRPELEDYASLIAELVLKKFPYIRTVCRKLGPMVGPVKEPQVEVIAGLRETETIHREGGCLFKLDVAKLMFAKGNINERRRMAEVVREGEVVFDMFAGIGYFTIPMARTGRPAVIYASDINPLAIHYLAENVRLNKVKGLVVPILADCRSVAERLPGFADRVVMGYIPGAAPFLPAALKALRPEGGVIHYHDTYHERELWWKPIQVLRAYGAEAGFRLAEVLYRGVVKSYGPRIYHVVVDARFEPA